jgi:hypothetical protein
MGSNLNDYLNAKKHFQKHCNVPTTEDTGIVVGKDGNRFNKYTPHSGFATPESLFDYTSVGDYVKGAKELADTWVNAIKEFTPGRYYGCIHRDAKTHDYAIVKIKPVKDKEGWYDWVSYSNTGDIKTYMRMNEKTVTSKLNGKGALVKPLPEFMELADLHRIELPRDTVWQKIINDCGLWKRFYSTPRFKPKGRAIDFRGMGIYEVLNKVQKTDKYILINDEDGAYMVQSEEADDFDDDMETIELEKLLTFRTN